MPTQTSTTVTMPRLGESVTEGTIGTWLKQIGDQIEKYEPLVEVETDKVNSEIPAPVSGVLAEILVEKDTTVPVGAELCRIEELAPAASQSWGKNNADSPKHAPDLNNGAAVRVSPQNRGAGGAVSELDLLHARSSPVVRRIAEEHGIDIAAIEGTGIGGRVTKQDILAHVAGPEPTHDLSVKEPVSPRTRLTTSAEPSPRLAVQILPGDEVIPLSSMRRQIAEHMVRSERTAPHVTTVAEVDMTRIVAFRAQHKEEFARRHGFDLTYLPFAIKAVTLAIRDHPRLNAVWDETQIIHRKGINIGVAVALDDGLIVPVIKNADRLSLTGLMYAIAELAGKARTGSLSPDDVGGGSFTINNPGTFGSVVSTPILVQPQVAILSTEAIIKRPVVIDDMIAIRSMMNLSLSIDHRALDGLAAARFLQQVKRWLETAELSLD